MNCPLCDRDTKVVETRSAPAGDGIRRRRECLKCHYRFTTVEEIALLDLVIVKRDGRRESYAREKLERGIVRALEKRPYTEVRLKQLLQNIERDIQKKRADELTSAEVGDAVMRRLASFDKVAYIRFASVYRQFEDVDMFAKELKALQRSKPKK